MFILKQELQPSCTVKPFIIGCETLDLFWKYFFNTNDMKDLFENVNIDDILSFLKETKLYHKNINVNLINITQSNHLNMISDDVNTSSKEFNRKVCI